MLTQNALDYNLGRRRVVQLMHLDSLQRQALNEIIAKFEHKEEIRIDDVVEAVVWYIQSLVELALVGDNDVCGENGQIIASVADSLQKFADAASILAKINFSFYEVFKYNKLREALFAATRLRDSFMLLKMIKLNYRLKRECYKLLETNPDKLVAKLEHIEQEYIEALAKAPPSLTRKFFAEHVVDKMLRSHEVTLSDVYSVLKRYALGVQMTPLSQQDVELLMQRYAHAAFQHENAFIYRAKVELFKLLDRGINDTRHDLELRKYAAEQVLKYINEVVGSEVVSKKQLVILNDGVINIYKAILTVSEITNLKNHVSKIVRIALDKNQLGIMGRILQLTDLVIGNKNIITLMIKEDISKMAKQTKFYHSKKYWLDTVVG